MAGNGPPGDPNAVRRNTRVGLVPLPAGGRTGRVPPWPLPPDPRLQVKISLLEDEIEILEERDEDDGLSRTERTKLSRTRERLARAQAELKLIEDGEKKIWRELWKTPQAVMWERLKWTRDVALYARLHAEAAIGSMDAIKEARQRGDALGLTPKGMRTLLWVIAADEVGERRQQRQAAAATGTEGRGRHRHLVAADDPIDDD